MSAYNGNDNLEVMAEAENYNRFLVELVIRSRGPSSSAVDFGAGTGTFAKAVHDRGVDVLCVKPDAALRSMISTRGLRVLPNLDAIQDASLTYLYSLNVLEHIEDDRGALRLIARKLAPKGAPLALITKR